MKRIATLAALAVLSTPLVGVPVLAPAMGQTATVQERAALTAPETLPDGLVKMNPDEISADDLIGAEVLGPNYADRSLGTVDDLVLSPDGAGVDALVMDVGGFLGLGEHRIALPIEEVTVARDGDGIVSVIVDVDKQQLEAQPEYQG